MWCVRVQDLREGVSEVRGRDRQLLRGNSVTWGKPMAFEPACAFGQVGCSSFVTPVENSTAILAIGPVYLCASGPVSTYLCIRLSGYYQSTRIPVHAN